MNDKLLLFILLCIGMMGCCSQQHIHKETVKIDSITQNTEILIQRVQSLANEFKVWEQKRDSVASRDSIAVRDSIVIRVNEDGNIISKERFHDTFQKSDRSSITENNTKTEILRQHIDSLLFAQKNELLTMWKESQQSPMPVERHLSKWESIKQEVGGIAIGIIVVVIAIAVIWLIYKIKR